MSNTPPSAAPTAKPDPHRVSTGASAPSGVTRLLSLVRRLIEYGQALAVTLQQNPSGPRFATIARDFGTLDLAVIIARITCGLRRATALEAKLNRYAARGRDVPETIPYQQSDCTGKPRKQPARKPAPDGLPTVEQIAAEVRRKPIGVVIGEICLDLGLMPGDLHALDPQLYRDVFDAFTRYGGSAACFFREKRKQLCRLLGSPRERAEPTPCAPTPAPATPNTLPNAHPTGPP